MTRHIVIHNHLPKRRAKDAESFREFEHGTKGGSEKAPTYRHKTSGKEIVSTQSPGSEWEKVKDAAPRPSEAAWRGIYSSLSEAEHREAAKTAAGRSLKADAAADPDTAIFHHELAKFHVSEADRKKTSGDHAKDDSTRVSELKVHLKDLQEQLQAANRAGDTTKAASARQAMADVRKQIESEGGWFGKDEDLDIKDTWDKGFKDGMAGGSKQYTAGWSAEEKAEYDDGFSNGSKKRGSKDTITPARLTQRVAGKDAAAKPPFESWMRDVDKVAYAIGGMSIHDLPDCPFRDWYDSGASARSAASRCIKAANE